MNKISKVDLYNNFNHAKSVSNFMFETADYVNKVLQEQGKPPLFDIDCESEKLFVIQDVPYKKQFGSFAGLEVTDFDCTDNDSLELIRFLDEYNRFNCEDGKFILDQSNIEYPDYFIIQDCELYITECPEDFLPDEYTTAIGTKPEYYTDGNALFQFDKNSGKLSFDKIFDTVAECHDFIVEYCENCNYISLGTRDPELVRAYLNDRMDDCISSEEEQEDLDWCTEALNQLDNYLASHRSQNMSKKIGVS